MPRIWRLVDSDLVETPVSAALDEAILDAHVMEAVPSTLHFYRRRHPSVSLGYFQKVSESVDLGRCEMRGVRIVRRRSGGSSIFSDSGQIIYGLVVHAEDLPRDMRKSFEVVCSAIASALRSFGVDARHRPVNDIEVGGRKVSGSAQLRRKGSVLMHGTVIVESDLALMDEVLRVLPRKGVPTLRPSERVANLSSLVGGNIDNSELKARIAVELGKAFDASFEPGQLTSLEKEMVENLVRTRYGTDQWNLKY